MPRLAKRESGRKSEGEPGGLGAVVTEWRAKGFGRAVFSLSVFGAFGSLAGMLAAVVLLSGDDRTHLLLLLGGPLVVCGLMALALLDRTLSVFRLYERGVGKSGPFGSRTLRFDEIDAVTFQAVHIYVQGIYTTTNSSVKIEGTSDAGPVRMTWAQSSRKDDTGMQRLCERISRAVAPRMLAELREQGSLPWTPRLVLTRSAIIDRKGTEIPLADVTEFNVEQGTFEVYVAGSRRPIVREPTAVPNFYPGLMIFERLLTGEPALAAEAPARRTSRPELRAETLEPAAGLETGQARATGVFMMALFGAAALFLTLGGAALVLWRTMDSEQAGLDALTVFFFPGVGALLALLAAWLLHGMERRRSRLWEANPTIAASRFSRPPDMGLWSRLKVMIPAGLFVILGVLPEVLVLMFVVGAK